MDWNRKIIKIAGRGSYQTCIYKKDQDNILQLISTARLHSIKYTYLHMRMWCAVHISYRKYRRN